MYLAQMNPEESDVLKAAEGAQRLLEVIATVGLMFLAVGVVAAVAILIWNFFSQSYAAKEARLYPVVFVVAGVFAQLARLPGAFYGIDSGADLKPEPSPGPAPKPHAPEAPSEPFNWAPILWIVAVLLIVLVAVILIAVVVHLVGRVRRARAHAEKLRRDRDRAWTEALAMWRTVKSDYTEYETDPQRVLSFPLIADVTEPATAAFHRAFDKAHSLARDTMPDTDAEIGAFAAAVDEARIALRAAFANAKKIGKTHLTTEQRDKLRRAEKALATVLDENAPAGERQNALDRVAPLIEGIVLMPEAAMKPVIVKLETIRRKELTG